MVNFHGQFQAQNIRFPSWTTGIQETNLEMEFHKIKIKTVKKSRVNFI